ncbi:MAG TPA: hypothetical protein VLW84_00940 [Terriglobales bacterium]|nr:hypothetical protein [Terriglobales bacterium]
MEQHDKPGARLVVRIAGVLIVLLGPTVILAGAQDTVNEFWPEVDTYVTFSPKYRLFFMAAQSVDQDSGQERWQFGPNLDISLKPILRMKFRTLDPEKRKYLTFRIGYRRLLSENGPDENRMILEVTPRYPLPKSFLLADRSRMDLRWRSGFSWRYRNRLSVERNFKIGRFLFTPYVRSEIFYDSAASRWNRLSYAGGVVVPIFERAEITPSFERQNISGSTPNHVNGAGLTLSLYF